MNEFDQAIQEFLKKGGKIQAIPAGKSGIVPGQSNSPWGKKKKAVEAVEEVEEVLVLEPEVIDLDELVEEESAADEDELEE
jgi:hypothetical protein